MKSSIKDFIRFLGIETIIVYVALVLRRRVAVFCSDSNLLLSTIRTLPQLVFARKDWNILRPLLRLNDADLKDFKVVFVIFSFHPTASHFLHTSKDSVWTFFLLLLNLEQHTPLNYLMV